MFLHTWHPHSILFHLGPLTVHWYGLTLAIGALSGFFVMQWLGKRYGLKEPIMFDYFITLIIAGLVGARIYHVTNEWAYYSQNPNQIFQVWNGGLAWHGGLLAGVIATAIFARRKKINSWLLADITVPALALGQAVGRWGNYFNQELFGRPTSWPWGIPIDPANRPFQFQHATYFHPTFLYESLGCLAIFGILLWLHRRQKAASRFGLISGVYIMLAAALRIGTESLRTDHTPTLWNIRLPIVVSSLLILAVIALYIVMMTRKKFSHAARPTT